MDGIVEICKKSEEMYGIKYDYYIGDGDSKVYKAVCDAMPYGKGFIIEKKRLCLPCTKEDGNMLEQLERKLLW